MAISKRYIASGAFWVGHRQPLILRAHLGTCVGVALYDETAGVGGLSHLLLPNPVSPGSAYLPEKYAVTALPLFFRALEEAGAHPPHLKAVVAGGALVGPVNHLDLSLDIGGRTAEIVKAMLTARGIAIVDSETGGFFTCSLELNMNTGQAAIGPVGLKETLPGRSFPVPEHEEVVNVADSIRPIPQVALRLMRMAEDDNFALDELAREVQTDQVLSAMTLRLCNSPAFSTGTHVDSIKQALILLGRKYFIKSVVTAAVDGFYRSSEAGYALCKGGLFHHALGTAMVARMIADLTGRVPGTGAYLAGLIHDIGKVVLDRFVSESYPFFYRASREGSQPLLQVEARLFGMDHAEVGEALARRWGLPDAMIDAIRNHHRPGHRDVAHADLVHVVSLASLLMGRFRSDLELDSADTGLLHECLARIGLTDGQLVDVVDQIPMSIFHENLSLSEAGRD